MMRYIVAGTLGAMELITALIVIVLVLAARCHEGRPCGRDLCRT